MLITDSIYISKTKGNIGLLVYISIIYIYGNTGYAAVFLIKANGIFFSGGLVELSTKKGRD